MVPVLLLTTVELPGGGGLGVELPLLVLFGGDGLGVVLLLLLLVLEFELLELLSIFDAFLRIVLSKCCCE